MSSVALTAVKMLGRSPALRQMANPTRGSMQVRTFFPKAQTRIYTKPLRKMSTAEELFWGVFFCTTMLSVPVWVMVTVGRTQE